MVIDFYNYLHMKKQCLLASVMALSVMMITREAEAQWTTVGSAGISTSGQSTWQHLVIDGANTPYVSFNDGGLATGQATVMKYNGTSWAAVGSAGFTPGSALHSYLTLDNAGTPYFSYADGASSSKVAVMKYNGTTWTSIGSDLTAGAGQYTNIKVSATGKPYLAYIDVSAANGVFVRSYNGTSWDTVGGAQISAGNANYPSIAFDHFDTLYIAYQDYTDGGRARVKKFNGTSWVNVGSSFLSEIYGGANDITLVFDSNNKPYVGYWNPYAGGPKAAVHKFDGANWLQVGLPSFTTGVSLYTSMALDHNDVPYIAYQDAAVAQQSVVMKYNGTTWVNVGTAGFSGGPTGFTSLAIDGNGNPFVAYTDGNNSQKTTVSTFTVCQAPTAAVAATSTPLLCLGDTAHLTASGTLNGASKWYWYANSCGGTPVDSGAAIATTPGDTTTYFVRGYGGCVVSGTCVPVTVNVSKVDKPTVTVNGTVLTSSAATGNQWYLDGNPVPGATAATYTITASGMYSVKVTAGNCSNTSAAIPVNATGITKVLPEGSMVLYPVPVTGTLHLNLSSSINDPALYQLSLTDQVGREVYKLNALQYKNELPMQQLSAGVYFVRITAASAQQVFKIIKQ